MKTLPVEYDLTIKIGDVEQRIASKGGRSKDFLRGLKNAKKGINYSINELIHSEEERLARLQE